MHTLAQSDGEFNSPWQISASKCTLLPRAVAGDWVALVRVDVALPGNDDAVFGYSVSIYENGSGDLTARLPEDVATTKGGALVIDDELAHLVRGAAIAAYRRLVWGVR